MFAREIYDTILDGSLEEESMGQIFNSICCSWNYKRYEEEIYIKATKILKKEYDLDMEELKQICSKNI
jgi:hypothetical protein